jgi:hypothetical protein
MKSLGIGGVSASLQEGRWLLNDPIIGNPFNLVFVSKMNHTLYDWHKNVRIVRPDNSVSEPGYWLNGKVYVKRAWFLPARAVEGIPILDTVWRVLQHHNVESLYNKLALYQCNQGEFSHMIDLLYNSPGCVSACDAWKYEDPESNSLRGQKNKQRIVKAVARFVENSIN